MSHVPVLKKEVLEYLDPRPNQNFIDATVGDGGHAAAILEKTSPSGKLIAIDRDPSSIVKARNSLAEFEKRVLFINDSFGNLEKIAKKNNFGFYDGILFDFGMSTSQLLNSGRGFSFQKDEILDMRYDSNAPVTAEDIINRCGEKELALIFRKWGEESQSEKIAEAIVRSRANGRIKTTKELVKIVDKAVRKRGRLHKATLVFQALRIEVNQELSEIEKALKALPRIILKGGRAAFISFHSLEDRLIKNWAKDLERQNKIKIINKKPIIASSEELRTNPNSRSAKLRIIEKIDYDGNNL